MKKDKVFICQSCQSRKQKVLPEKVNFLWTTESFKQMKLNFKKQNQRKTDKKVVLTSCLGLCPDNAVAYQETSSQKLQEEKSYPFSWTREQIYKFFFK